MTIFFLSNNFTVRVYRSGVRANKLPHIAELMPPTRRGKFGGARIPELRTLVPAGRCHRRGQALIQRQFCSLKV